MHTLENTPQMGPAYGRIEYKGYMYNKPWKDEVSNVTVGCDCAAGPADPMACDPQCKIYKSAVTAYADLQVWCLSVCQSLAARLLLPSAPCRRRGVHETKTTRAHVQEPAALSFSFRAALLRCAG